MTRLLLTAVCFAGLALAAEGEAERQVIDTVQKTFDALAAKNPDALKKLFLPEARLVAARNGKLSNTPVEQFATRVSGMEGTLLERMWNPKVMVHGDIAVLWAEYDFHHSGKFTHCGIDVANLVKTEDGWKIASLQYTAETEGCKPSPLGPPTKQ